MELLYKAPLSQTWAQFGFACLAAAPLPALTPGALASPLQLGHLEFTPRGSGIGESEEVTVVPG